MIRSSTKVLQVKL
jgi:hypothetical protein